MKQAVIKVIQENGIIITESGKQNGYTGAISTADELKNIFICTETLSTPQTTLDTGKTAIITEIANGYTMDLTNGTFFRNTAKEAIELTLSTLGS